MVKMTPEEFTAFSKRSALSYANDLAKSQGITVEEARSYASKQLEGFLPDGIKTSGHEFYFIQDADGEKVGHLWFGIREQFGKNSVYIFDLEVYEAHRGKGYAQEALNWLDRWSLNAGFDQIRLNVFGFNVGVQKLYKKMNFEVASQQMVKRLK